MPASNSSTTPGRGGHSRWLAAVGVLLLVGGAIAWFTQTPRPDVEAAGSSPSGQEVVASSSTTVREAIPAPTRPGAPHRVVIPRLAVDAPVLPIRAPGGTLVPPSNPQQLGWWAGGARPGDTRGSALVTGHTVHTGGGALDDLETLARGDAVRVRTAHGWIRYAVRSVRIYGKGSVARDAPRLFSQRVPGRLVLVTCEDWDGAQYLSNVVVTAEPARERPE